MPARLDLRNYLLLSECLGSIQVMGVAAIAIMAPFTVVFTTRLGGVSRSRVTSARQSKAAAQAGSSLLSRIQRPVCYPKNAYSSAASLARLGPWANPGGAKGY